MKSNEQISELIIKKQFDGVRYACLERLKEDRLDVQAWVFLGQSMLGKKRSKMADLCFRRAVLIDPFANWVNEAYQQVRDTPQGNDDKQVLKLLEVPNVTVSACILTRDSGRTIRPCIEALRDATDEIIVVDTGSVDDTVSIVESLGVRVHHFDWCDDFSAARNYAQSLATSDWVIAVDSDEILYSEDVEAIRTVAAVYQLSTTSVIIRSTIVNVDQGIEFPSFMGRMCKRESGAMWTGKIHEELTLYEPCFLQTMACRFRHDGYARSVNQTDKTRRNIDILRKAIDGEPKNYQYHYYLGRELSYANEFKQAEVHIRNAMKLSKMYMPDAHSTLVRILVDMGRSEDAKVEARLLAKSDPSYPDGWGWLAVITGNQDYAQRYADVATQYRGIYVIDPRLAITIIQQWAIFFR